MNDFTKYQLNIITKPLYNQRISYSVIQLFSYS